VSVSAHEACSFHAAFQNASCPIASGMTNVDMLDAISTLIVCLDQGLRSASHQRVVTQAQQHMQNSRGEMSCKGDVDEPL